MTTTVTQPVIRESGIATGLTWVGLFWALGFALNTVLVADQLTSPQWISLMTVPGGKWFWGGLFGGAAIVTLIGILRVDYRARAVGFAMIAVGGLGIATFYVIAPVFHAGVITLGYWPWFVPAGFSVVAAIVNWWPITWF